MRDVALVELMFSTGMRVSEISNLRVTAIDLERRAGLVRGNGNRERLIPICDADVYSALTAYFATKGTRQEIDGHGWTSN
jgi:integrase/recombinase XerD